ncbi:MAG: hypothetical protein JRI34_02295 [Deltaproteobacteria bacterium]|nr:hypothetical protein [Deltaproteobacteria bacterium]
MRNLKGMEYLERLSYIINLSKDSVEVFADKCGKHKSQIYTYLKGKQLPGMEFFTKMKKSYPWVPLEWLISEIGEPPVNESRDPQEVLEDFEGLPVAHQVDPAPRKNKNDEIGVMFQGKDKSLSIDVFLHYVEELGKLKERIRLIEAELKSHEPPNGIERRSAWQKFDKIFFDIH